MPSYDPPSAVTTALRACALAQVLGCSSSGNTQGKPEHVTVDRVLNLQLGKATLVPAAMIDGISYRFSRPENSIRFDVIQGSSFRLVETARSATSASPCL
jgi:hypothetical protein